MSQLGEAIAVEVMKTLKEDCPFSHEPDSKNFENDLIGSGGTLGENMSGQISAIRNPALAGKKPPKEEDPAKRKGHPLHGKEPVLLMWDGMPVACEVTCAAHHLIPAQASLAKSDILTWMIKKGKPGSVKEGKNIVKVSGDVNNNVGYDVNGAENGVWLPGPYWMRGVWTDMPEDEEDAAAGKSGNAKVGAKFAPGSQKEYAIGAMRLCDAQFHDAHPDYSKIVLDALNTIAARYDTVVQTKAVCDGCKEKLKKGIPAPYAIVLKLNAISRRMRGFLEGAPSAWKKAVFTSAWSVEYMKNPDYASEYNK